MSFENLDLNDELLQAVSELGFVEPTPIQTDAIPEIIGGDRDLIGLAQTGTGKTAAFGLPMIQLIDFQLTHTQVHLSIRLAFLRSSSKALLSVNSLIEGRTVLWRYRRRRSRQIQARPRVPMAQAGSA